MLKILQKKFRMKPLTVAVASVISLTAGSMAFAQDDAEEIVITGIKASLQQAMDVKRESAGVVDAISAEDMGKFPDTNLAESLQRITGVSISRDNGEGSKITVRGFGDQNNMVTLNGRMMPAAGVYGGGSGASGTSGGATRGFDFANLASESVSGVQVYKTGKANIATGGIGATVNIQTMKPLDREGFKASIGAKALSDSTNRTGDDVTPELSGLVSWTDDSGMFGVGLTASHQERDSGSSSIWVNDWNVRAWGADHIPNAPGVTSNNKGLYSFTSAAKITNQPKVGQLYARPNDIRYIFSDTQRTRDNAQLTLQWAPTDKITASADYTFAENNLVERRGESTSWLDNGTSIDEVLFDTGVVAAPLYIHETKGPRDQGYEQQLREQTNTLNSAGFNIAFEATDSLTLNFDAHNSKMESLPTGPAGSGEIAATIGTPTQVSHSLDFRGDAPLFTMTNDDTRFRDANSNGIYDAGEVRIGNNNGVYDAGDIGSQVVRITYADQINEITEAKISGVFTFDDGHFDFGVESRAMENSNKQLSTKYMAMGDWGIATPGDIPASLVQNYDYAGQFDDFATSKSFHGGFKGNAEDLAAYLTTLYKSKGTTADPYCVCLSPTASVNSTVEEDTNAIYAQVGVKGELAGMATNFLVGVRYETTDVSSSALVNAPSYLLWQDNNDFQVTIPSGQTPAPYTVESSYDNLLPSMDFDIALTDDVKGRFSFGETIARAGYGSLSSAVSNYGSGGGSTALGAIRTASSGNPALLPLQSTNVDMSLEWYYDDSSYVSAGVFEKRVKNFISTEQVTETLFNIKDQTSATSPRVIAARAALTSGGFAVDDTALFAMMAILDNPNAFPTGAAAYNGTLAQQQAIATTYDIIPRADDPVSNWRVSKPVNNKEAKIYGAEFAVQHFFGETGFGLQANYTIVRGDIGFNDAGDPSIQQFALVGLSDTANLVAIYEKNDIQARIAYNWRDEYLSNASRGNARNPVYVEAYSQVDANISYNVTEALTVSIEALNLLGADSRSHGRTVSMLEEMYDLGPRYTLGARYSF